MHQRANKSIVAAASAYGAALWLLTTLFALRVAGQAVQRWIPQSVLPPFHAFQGSALPYSTLLLAQLAILALMIHISRRAQLGTLRASARTARVLAWSGWVYLVAALLRIAIGIVFIAAPAWFKAWIPSLFHVVLAGFVLTLSAYHRTQAPSTLEAVKQ